MIEHSKYDFDLDMINTNSLSLIINQIKRGSTVLEFGPANGRMTKYLKEALDCKVYLVEIDEEAAKEAAQYGEDLVIDDIETYSWYDKYENIRFDYITFADVLEHLRNPEEVLIRAKQLLKQDGSILFSVPNLAHNSVLISLLNHEFEYNKTGLLDNTHIHFFTKNSLENAMNRTGLTVAKRFATYAPTGATEIPVHNEDVPGIDPVFWKTRRYGEIYQYVYEVKKGPEFIGETENYITGGLPHYYSQLYMDRGKGFDESDSITTTMGNVDKTAVITMEAIIGEDVSKLRFDPINAPCFMEIISFTDLSEGEDKPLRVAATNATYSHGNRYMFMTNDPAIELMPVSGKKFHSVKLVYKMISLSDTLINEMGDIWNEAMLLQQNVTAKEAMLDARNAQLESAVAQKDAELNALRNECAVLKQTVNEALNSTSWKITKPLRKIGDILRGR
ncbi:MAG: class I SAM-dependent methyltransferase [Lachnospiraceae bacterium]|nr:class I SAM-dependent methyltransferase [Lachnospiraceae bacterium]